MRHRLTVKKIRDKTDDEGVDKRYVLVQDEKGTVKITYNDELSNLPSVILHLDRATDFNAVVEVDIDFQLTERQSRISDDFKSRELEEKGVDIDEGG